MLILTKNYKKLFLLCIKNNFEGGAQKWDPVDLKTEELKELGKNGIEKSKNEKQLVENILKEISNYSTGSDKVTEKQLEEIINFLDKQSGIAFQKESENKILGNVSNNRFYSDSDNYKISNFLGEKKRDFEKLKDKYFKEKNIIIVETKKQKIDNTKIEQLERRENNKEEIITPLEKIVVEKSDITNTPNIEKIDYSLIEAKKFYKKVGASKENIMAIQGALGFGEKKLELDGKFGPQTFNAVINFQKENGLIPDGKVGNITLKKMISEEMTVDSFYKKITSQLNHTQKLDSGNQNNNEGTSNNEESNNEDTSNNEKSNNEDTSNNEESNNEGTSNNNEKKEKEKTLEKTNQNQEKLKMLGEYFGIKQKDIKKINEAIKNSGLENILSIIPFLEKYKDFIETNLKGLDKKIIKKITESIGKRLNNITNVINDRIDFVDKKIQEKDYKVKDRNKEIKNQRWIINEHLNKSFYDINTKILPSAQVLLKIEQNKNSISKRQNNLYDVNSKIEELKKMFEANILDNGYFDKTWTSGELIDSNTDNWDIFDSTDRMDKRFFLEEKIKSITTPSLLNEKDLEIQSEATIYFMAAIAVQVGGEILGGPIGMLIGALIDAKDIYSDTEVLLDIVQGAGLVNPNYRMEKTLIDNILAGLGLLPGMTQAVKGKKIADFLSKLGPKEKKIFKNAIVKIKEKMGITKNIDEPFDIKKMNLELRHLESKGKIGENIKIGDYIITKIQKGKFNISDGDGNILIKNKKNQEIQNFFKEKNNINYKGNRKAANNTNFKLDMRAAKIDLGTIKDGFQEKLEDLIKILNQIPNDLKPDFNKLILTPFSKIKEFNSNQVEIFLKNIDIFKQKLGNGFDNVKNKLDELGNVLKGKPDFDKLNYYDVLKDTSDKTKIIKNLKIDLESINKKLKINNKNLKNINSKIKKIKNHKDEFYKEMKGPTPSGKVRYETNIKEDSRYKDEYKKLINEKYTIEEQIKNLEEEKHKLNSKLSSSIDSQKLYEQVTKFWNLPAEENIKLRLKMIDDKIYELENPKPNFAIIPEQQTKLINILKEEKQKVEKELETIKGETIEPANKRKS